MTRCISAVNPSSCRGRYEDAGEEWDGGEEDEDEVDDDNTEDEDEESC